MLSNQSLHLSLRMEYHKREGTAGTPCSFLFSFLPYLSPSITTSAHGEIAIVISYHTQQTFPEKWHRAETPGFLQYLVGLFYNHNSIVNLSVVFQQFQAFFSICFIFSTFLPLFKKILSFCYMSVSESFLTCSQPWYMPFQYCLPMSS